MSSVKALVWTNTKEMKYESVEHPIQPDGWILLRTSHVGICGSEVSAFLGHNELRKPPSVMGHEFSGVPIDLEPREDDALHGNYVAVNPLVTCGNCRQCLSGNRQLCPNRKLIGVNFPGGFSEIVAVPKMSCYRIKDATLGAIAEPLATAVRITDRAKTSFGDTFLVIGAGTIGLFTTKLLQGSGASEIIVSDTNEKRLLMAEKWGATHTINPLKEDLSSFVRNIISSGVDVAVDAVGYSKTRNTAVSSVRPGGHVILVGLRESSSEIPGNLVVRNELNIEGSFAYTDVEFRRAVELLNRDFLSLKGGWLEIRSITEGHKAFLEQSSDTSPYAKTILKHQ